MSILIWFWTRQGSPDRDNSRKAEKFGRKRKRFHTRGRRFSNRSGRLVQSQQPHKG